MEQPGPKKAGRRIGELAQATGLTVRTLHYYEEIGLAAPERTKAGHRIYRDPNVERLYRVCLLRRLGFPLSEIAHALDDPKWSLRSAMTAHLGDLEKRIEAMSRLRSQLAQLVATDVPIDGPLTNDLLQVLEEMIMLDTTVQRRISILVYSDIEASYGYLERVFGLGPGQLTATRVDTSFTARSKQATVWCGFTQNLLNSRWPPQVARSHYGEYGRDGR